MKTIGKKGRRKSKGSKKEIKAKGEKNIAKKREIIKKRKNSAEKKRKNSVGERIKITLDKLYVADNGDPSYESKGELYYSFNIDDKALVTRKKDKPKKVKDKATIRLNKSKELDIGNKEAIEISGYVGDADNGFQGKDEYATASVTLEQSNNWNEGSNKLHLKDGKLDVILYYTVAHIQPDTEEYIQPDTEEYIQPGTEPITEGYEDISLAHLVTFYGYKESDKAGCYRRCQDMLASCNYASVAVTDASVVQMAKYKSAEEQVLVIQNDVEKGVQVIHDHLENEKPIMVGVDHSLGHPGNYDETTDHWIVVVGRKTDSEGTHFLFFDPQTSHKSIGTSEDNKLTVQDDYSLKGTYRGKTYTVTMVRPSIDN